MKHKSLALAALASVAFLALARPAAAYSKPQGVPTLDLTPLGYPVTIAVFAVQTGVGGAIGVFEYKPVSQDWSLCGNCITTPELPNLDAAVNALTALGYIASKKAEMNTVLATRYPPIGAPIDGVGKVNQALNGFSLVIVNGVPSLSP